LCESAYTKYVQDKLILQDTTKNAANPSAAFPAQGEMVMIEAVVEVPALPVSYPDSLFLKGTVLGY